MRDEDSMAVERRVRLLVSVVTADEVEAALAGGADIVDPLAKDSNRRGATFRRSPDSHDAPPTYQAIARQALHLRQLGLSNTQIATALKADAKTVVKGIRWIQTAGEPSGLGSFGKNS